MQNPHASESPPPPFGRNPAFFTPQRNVEAVPRSACSAEGHPARRALAFGTKKPVERTLSHEGSGIHAEWCQLEGSPQQHVQLSVGELAPPPLSAAYGSGHDGMQEKTAVAAALMPAGSGNGGSPCCSATLTPCSSYLRLACWLALLFAGYGIQRGLCAAGLPYDCDPVNAFDVYSTLTVLAFAGGALGWLAGVTRPARFAWLAAPRRLYLWVTYAAMFPAYSGVSTIPAMHESLVNVGQWGPAAIAVIVSVALVVAAALAFHIWLALYPTSDVRASASASAAAIAPEVAALEGGPAAAAVAPDSPGSSRSGSEAAAEPSSFSALDDKLSAGGSSGEGSLDGGSSRGSPRKGGKGSSRRHRFRSRSRTPRRPRQRSFKTLSLYLLPRLAVLLYFVVWFAALAGSGSFELHLHHYALGWAVASLAAFNHPVSGMLLALGTAVFVQGAGSYGFDPLFSPAGNATGGCLNVTSPKTGQMTCAFWAERPFNLSFCSDSNWIPWFDCSVDWPWPNTKITKKMLITRDFNFSVPGPLTPLVPLVPLTPLLSG